MLLTIPFQPRKVVDAHTGAKPIVEQCRIVRSKEFFNLLRIDYIDVLVVGERIDWERCGRNPRFLLCRQASIVGLDISENDTRRSSEQEEKTAI